ncbi:MAG: hypothetical protein OSA89_18875 [Mariniblastus sp.]|nr:hypothetical protein [Mariniblastus sp.]
MIPLRSSKYAIGRWKGFDSSAYRKLANAERETRNDQQHTNRTEPQTGSVPGDKMPLGRLPEPDIYLT